MINNGITKLFINALEKSQFGRLHLVFPDGQSRCFFGSNEGPTAHLKLHDLSVIPAIATGGDVALAETYRDGWWDSDDLGALILYGLINKDNLSRYINGTRIRRAAHHFQNFMRRNSYKGSMRNISAHYDLGNDFYALWLDEGMTYSSALFLNEEESLYEAQNNKYDRLLSRIGFTSQSVLEIGCGWGGFAERTVTQTDHKLRAITLSPAQCEYAHQRLSKHRRRANIQLQDYRDQHGRYDSIVSIEMFEAVGERYWPVYFRKAKQLLADHGRLLMQTITIDDAYFNAYRKQGDAIRQLIFPGGLLPSELRLKQVAQNNGLVITDRFEFGQHYARTLEHWLSRFNAQEAAILAQGKDQRFVRLWRYYLASCIAAFRCGRTNVVQLELSHA